MQVSQIKFIQEHLKQRGLYTGAIDGSAGPMTMRALEQAEHLPAGWPNTRKLAAYVQLTAKREGIEVGLIDGIWGSQTQHAYDTLVHKANFGTLPRPWRDLPPLGNPNNWPRENSGAFNSLYGPPGDSRLTRIELPYPHRLAWDKRKVVNSFVCNKAVHDSLKRVLGRVHDHYGDDEIRRLGLDLWGGCYNKRKKRGGTSWSMHSWGIALDYDPERNQLQWGRDRANLARPDYDAWWDIWEDEGWFSLGRQRNFDWMHVQAAHL